MMNDPECLAAMQRVAGLRSTGRSPTMDGFLFMFDSLGLIYKHLDRYEEAQACYERVYRTCQSAGPGGSMLPESMRRQLKGTAMKAVSLYKPQRCKGKQSGLSDPMIVDDEQAVRWLRINFGDSHPAFGSDRSASSILRLWFNEDWEKIYNQSYKQRVSAGTQPTQCPTNPSNQQTSKPTDHY